MAQGFRIQLPCNRCSWQLAKTKEAWSTPYGPLPKTLLLGTPWHRDRQVRNMSKPLREDSGTKYHNMSGPKITNIGLTYIEDDKLAVLGTWYHYIEY